MFDNHIDCNYLDLEYWIDHEVIEFRIDVMKVDCTGSNSH